MTEQQFHRKAYLLSKGKLLVPVRNPQEPGTAGVPYISANGLGRYYVVRTLMKEEGKITFEYADDPDGLLERAATRIRRERFSEPTFDYTRSFPLTRRLAYAAFPDIRPKNHVPQATP